jgi:D-tagatose-1,6-bisphosphate aldolase subunit GatZ/KbaZ
VKGHYTDWVVNPEAYPATGIGAANVGPEFSAEEFKALGELEEMEHEIIGKPIGAKSGFMGTLQKAVVESGRWIKWLQPEEKGRSFSELSVERKDWLLKTCSRYIWTNEEVLAARLNLYKNMKEKVDDPHGYVVEKITLSIEKYIIAFNLQNSVTTLGI